MNERTVLVTGGAGYIGSHACKALAAAGWTVVVLDNLCAGHREAVKWGALEVVDLLDAAGVMRVMATHRPAAVMHFAGFLDVGESVREPGKYWRNNVTGSLHLLDAATAHGVTALVFSSTCATYGLPQQVPIREDHPQVPISPYGASKLAVERMLADFEPAGGPRWTALRYFNAAGCDPDGETGEDHDPEIHLIPVALQVAAGKRKQMAIFGDDYDTPDGTCVRDYIHVTDLADAHVRALDRLMAGGASMACNLANSRGFSVREVIDAARRVTGHAIPAVVGPRRPGDPPVLIGDATRARAELGWTPRLDTLDNMVGTAWAWMTRPGPSSAQQSGEASGAGEAS
ncbi:MAG: UDP-glucose 4-epimerase GalE [Planctomycetota bacterium]